MKLSYLLMLGVVLLSYTSYSQSIDFNNYLPLQSKGDLPKDFSERTSDKVEAAIEAKITTTDDRNSAKQKAEFLLRSNYMIDNLLMSGNVLFGDPVTDYINKVADIVLKDDPNLREELRFYCIKSNITNAFTTDQGMIFVSLGLLAQLENEAQLAFILGHEINHYKEDHVINSVLENDKILEGSRSRKKNKSSDATIIELSNYSKSLEMESDSIGFFFSQSTGYDLEEVLNSFNILQFSHLPYDEIEMDYSMFEFENFMIPEEYKLDSLIEINFEVDEDDSKSTHPNLTKRREQISSMLEKHGNNNKGVYYQVSENEFNEVRKASRYESIRIDLKNLNFVRAFYNSMFLLKTTPNSNYLKESLAKSLYGIAKFKLNKKYFKFADDFEDYEGAISAAYYFFEELEKNAVATIAIKKIFEINKEQKNEHLNNILINLITDFIEENDSEKFDFDEFFPIEIIEVMVVEGDQEEGDKHREKSDISGSKYEKLKKLREKQKSEKGIVSPENYDFYRLIFVNYTERGKIKEMFDSSFQLLLEKLDEEKKLSEKYDNMSSREKQRQYQVELKNDKKYTEIKNNIGAESVIFVDPQFYSIDERKGVKLENSEEKKHQLYDRLNSIGTKSGIAVNILSPKIKSEADSELMNHLSICNDWVEEIGKVADIDYDINYIPSQSEYMKVVSDAYQCDNIAFTGVIDFKMKKDRKGFILLAGVIYFPVLPLAIAYVLTPKYEFYYYNYIFDAKTGELIVNKIYSMNKKSFDGNLNSYMYDLFQTIKIKK